MEVRIFPNPRRPGVGLRPRREGQRPHLPQHARHCPVLEAGSTLGFLVHAPLGEHESFQATFEGEGRYRLEYAINATGARWERIFSTTYVLPVGGLGKATEDVELHVAATPESREAALLMARMFIVPEDLGTPAGAVTLRGAWSFQTPPAWDAVYTPIFNMIERPIAPGLAIRVETDWYPHDTEFRYVLQPGESVSASHGMPIGQVFFVPREDVTFRDATDEDRAERLRSVAAFSHSKAGVRLRTPYGLEYSPHYLRASRRQDTPLTVAQGAIGAAGR